MVWFQRQETSWVACYSLTQISDVIRKRLDYADEASSWRHVASKQIPIHEPDEELISLRVLLYLK